MTVPSLFSPFLVICSLWVAHGNQLSLYLQSAAREIEIGQPFALSLQFENVGSNAFYIERPITWSERSIEIIAQGEGCTQSARFAHVATLVEMEPLRFVPLLPGEKLQTQLPLINLAIVAELDLVEPGKYWISAVFVSEGSEAAGGPSPVWRGRCSSRNTLEVSVIPASEVIIRRMCSELSGKDPEPACWYFRYVKDGNAADELIRLFKQTSAKGPPPSLVEAIMYQGRVGDATVLWEASQSLLAPTALRRYYASAAESLRHESGDPCRPWRPE